ncbi:MAG: sec-independent protein translocase protein TatA [Parvicella sp.]|jgi:sec-independent protein translocase protein TatA
MSLLFLNSISGGEIAIIFLFILMVFGADSIPSIARNLGRGIRQIKDATQDIQRDIARSTGDPVKEITKVKDQIEDTINQNDLN